MDYKARRRHTTVLETSDLKDNYPHDIQIYDVPPMGEMSLEDFQELGFDRLKGILYILYIIFKFIYYYVRLVVIHYILSIQ